MDDDQREILRVHILQQIKDLKKDIQSYEQITRPVAPDNAIGRLTRMDAMYSKRINDAALHACRQRLVHLEVALTSLFDADYGYCQACEEPIPFARLKLMPEARFCVHCAQQQ